MIVLFVSQIIINILILLADNASMVQWTQRKILKTKAKKKNNKKNQRLYLFLYFWFSCSFSIQPHSLLPLQLYLLLHIFPQVQNQKLFLDAKSIWRERHFISVTVQAHIFNAFGFFKPRQYASARSIYGPDETTFGLTGKCWRLTMIIDLCTAYWYTVKFRSTRWSADILNPHTTDREVIPYCLVWFLLKIEWRTGYVAPSRLE